MCVGIETNHTYALTCSRFVHSGGTLLVPMFSSSDVVDVSLSFVCLHLLKKYISFFPTHFVASFSPAEMTDIEKGGMKKSASLQDALGSKNPSMRTRFFGAHFCRFFRPARSINNPIRALRVVLLFGVASMTRRDRNFKTSSSSSSETFGDARIPKRREFWTWHFASRKRKENHRVVLRR